MEENKNYYAKRAKKRGFLGEITAERATDGNLKDSAIETAKDLAVGVVGGGIVGAMMGRFSLLAGTGMTFLSHYFKKHLGSMARAFGISMMASGSYEPPKTVSGTEDKGIVEGVTERVMNFKDQLTSKLFVDKLLKNGKEKKQEKSSDENKQVDSGDKSAQKEVGSVQYFLYPGAKANKVDDHMKNLERVEAHLQQSASDYQENNGEVSGTEGADEIDPTDKNY